MKKRILLSVLLMTLVLLLFGCGTESTDPQGTDADTADFETDLIFASGGNTEYVIVRAEEATRYEVRGAMLLRDRIQQTYGLQLALITDYESERYSDRKPTEIILGKITDEGVKYTVDRDALGKYGYRIFSQEGKYVIVSNCYEGYEMAIEAFLAQVLRPADADILSAAANVDLFADSETVKAQLPARFDVANKEDLVGICYSTWFDPIIAANGQNDPPDISKVLSGESDWGPLHAFHYWAEPALGYYASSDKSVIRQHMIWLAEAGVDFIILDNTNANVGWKGAGTPGDAANYWEAMITNPMTALLDTIVEMRAEGLETPYVATWCPPSVVDALMQEFYRQEKYADCWVYWDQNPFFLLTNADSAIMGRDDITCRVMWGLQGSLGVSEWSFLNVPSKVSYDEAGKAEQVGVCVAAQQTYMSYTDTATGREGGKTFYQGWKTAFEERPKFVTLTWWNEWAAQRFEDENGNSRFVDNYTPAYSRDIEPMKGGHGDTYYQWMKQYIAAYKGYEVCPKLYEAE